MAQGLFISCSPVSFWGNLLSSVIASDFNMFLVTRMMAGIGSGGVVSLSFAMVGMTSNPDRNFGLMVSVAMISGAIVMYLAPGIMEASGLSGLLYLFSALGAVGLFLVRFAPLSLKEEAQDTLEVSPNQLDANPFECRCHVRFLAGAGWCLGLFGFDGGGQGSRCGRYLKRLPEPVFRAGGGLASGHFRLKIRAGLAHGSGFVSWCAAFADIHLWHWWGSGISYHCPDL